ncbi:unnamed protein product [Closterium sp. NIES-65]|nr:unnamed protein product [Closterium sp. NIES-65]
MALSQPSPGPQAVPVTNVISPYQHFPGSSPDQYPSLFQQYQPWNSHAGGPFGMPPLLPGAPQQFPPASPQQYSPAPPQFPPASPQQFAPPSPQFPPGSTQQFPPASPHQFPPASPQFPQGSAQQFPPQQFPPQQFPPQQMFGMGFARGPPGQFSPSPNFSPPTMSAQNVPPGLGAQAMSPLMGPPSGFGPHNIPRNNKGSGAGNAGMGAGGPAGGGGNQRRGQQARAGQQPTEESTQRTVYVSDIDHQVTEEQLATLFLSCGQVVDCRICGDPNSVLRFAFVEFTDEVFPHVCPFLCTSRAFSRPSHLNQREPEGQCWEGAKNALSIAGTMLGYYPLRVLPSKTAILPVNPTYLPKCGSQPTQPKVALSEDVPCGVLLGYYPLRVLPSKTAILPVNPTYLPKVPFRCSQEEREMCARTVYCTNIDKKVTQADVKLFFESLCGEISRLRLLGDYHHSTRIAFVEFVMAESAMAALNCSGAILGSLPISTAPPHLSTPSVLPQVESAMAASNCSIGVSPSDDQLAQHLLFPPPHPLSAALSLSSPPIPPPPRFPSTRVSPFKTSVRPRAPRQRLFLFVELNFEAPQKSIQRPRAPTSAHKRPGSAYSSSIQTSPSSALARPPSSNPTLNPLIHQGEWSPSTTPVLPRAPRQHRLSPLAPPLPLVSPPFFPFPPPLSLPIILSPSKAPVRPRAPTNGESLQDPCAPSSAQAAWGEVVTGGGAAWGDVVSRGGAAWGRGSNWGRGGMGRGEVATGGRGGMGGAGNRGRGGMGGGSTWGRGCTGGGIN